GGSAVEIEAQADDLRHMRDTVLGLIAQDTGQPVERDFEDSLHDRWYTAVEIEVQADDLRQMRDTVLGLISDDTGQPAERIFEDSLHDRWYTTAQAQEYGFIDAIVSSVAEVMPRRRARVGLGTDAAASAQEGARS
ncbi:MAG: ATP-dependent Clp protease proteolytic subunit, partial [Microbacterium sp.]|uniref:ATP-dependent Clp protease proteolytic subunit n=1 Tax=Microbacterium sp. TaxID=51671 RepID=UPI002603E8DD